MVRIASDGYSKIQSVISEDQVASMLCRGCSKRSYSGHHFTCLICFDYSLCEDCHSKKHISMFHTNSHAMQCVGLQTADNQHSLACPFCSEQGFFWDGLVSHIQSDHNGETAEVLCPLCVAQSASVNFLKYDELLVHMNYTHEFGTFTPQREGPIIQYINQHVNPATGIPIFFGTRNDSVMFSYQFSADLPYDRHGYIFTEGKDPRNRG
ncbi:E3 ubiquitin-protein ligase KCMF1 [Trichinella nativa]|uniref:E3 ubiquitin-protein ligase KCMF1 n=1 Tax=Trichinella nativa TaxID=6335 RepID=A0A0V1LJ93_9BILA|nr:E3 ubiquitin-protein ligase KCMF1 [Trichinella nativa]